MRASSVAMPPERTDKAELLQGCYMRQRGNQCVCPAVAEPVAWRTGQMQCGELRVAPSRPRQAPARRGATCGDVCVPVTSSDFRRLKYTSPSTSFDALPMPLSVAIHRCELHMTSHVARSQGIAYRQCLAT